MARSLEKIFDDVRARQFDPRLEHIEASYRFDVEGSGSYRLEVDRGKLRVSKSDAPADCVIGCSREDLVLIADGEQNLLTAAMQGRVHFEGNLALAKLLHGLLPGPEHAQAQEVQP